MDLMTLIEAARAGVLEYHNTMRLDALERERLHRRKRRVSLSRVATERAEFHRGVESGLRSAWYPT